MQGNIFKIEKNALPDGQGLTATALRGALLGDKLPMETWRAIGSALDRLDPEG